MCTVAFNSFFLLLAFLISFSPVYVLRLMFCVMFFFSSPVCIFVLLPPWRNKVYIIICPTVCHKIRECTNSIKNSSFTQRLMFRQVNKTLNGELVNITQGSNVIITASSQGL